MSDNDSSPKMNKTTPPPVYKVRNPFERPLIGRLHKPICSPGMCKVYKLQSNGSFRWEIDQTCTLTPAQIVACSSQFEPSPDPALDRLAEDAADRYFSQEAVVASPYQPSKKVVALQVSHADESIQIGGFKTRLVRHAGVQTTLTLPPRLPPEVEAVLEKFCTYNQEEGVSYEYSEWVVSVGGSGLGTPHSAHSTHSTHSSHSPRPHYEEELTDEERASPLPMTLRLAPHQRLAYSPDLSTDVVRGGMARTFGTPLKKIAKTSVAGFHSRARVSADAGDERFHEPEPEPDVDVDVEHRTPSSFTSASISPITKPGTDDEKNNLTSPESEGAWRCGECARWRGVNGSRGEEHGAGGGGNAAREGEAGARTAHCCCLSTPTTRTALLRRTLSMREAALAAEWGAGGGAGGGVGLKRSLSMSSLQGARRRSVQRLDFTLDMSLDTDDHHHHHHHQEHQHQHQHLHHQHDLLRSRSRLARSDSSASPGTSPRGCARAGGGGGGGSVAKAGWQAAAAAGCSPMDMSLDASLEDENALSLEDKHFDFNNVDLRFLADMEVRGDVGPPGGGSKPGSGSGSVSLARLDSGFNENTTLYGGCCSGGPGDLGSGGARRAGALRELSNVQWARADSGLPDEGPCPCPCEPGAPARALSLHDKENVFMDDFDRFVRRNPKASSRVSPLQDMSMTELFSEELPLHRHYCSTPSKPPFAN